MMRAVGCECSAPWKPKTGPSNAPVLACVHCAGSDSPVAAFCSDSLRHALTRGHMPARTARVSTPCRSWPFGALAEILDPFVLDSASSRCSCELHCSSYSTCSSAPCMLSFSHHAFLISVSSCLVNLTPFITLFACLFPRLSHPFCPHPRPPCPPPTHSSRHHALISFTVALQCRRCRHRRVSSK